MYNDILFNVVDEIDHFTLRYRQSGEFDCKKANRMIRKYSEHYREVEKMSLKFRTDEELKLNPVAGLYDDLIKIRTVLLDESGLK